MSKPVNESSLGEDDRPPMALYRFFSTERDEPICIFAPAAKFSHYFSFRGRFYKSEGPTPLSDYPSSIPRSEISCAWDFSESLLRIFPPSYEQEIKVS